jgi:hypothetical protein
MGAVTVFHADHAGVRHGCGMPWNILEMGPTAFCGISRLPVGC